MKIVTKGEFAIYFSVFPSPTCYIYFFIFYSISFSRIIIIIVIIINILIIINIVNRITIIICSETFWMPKK